MLIDLPSVSVEEQKASEYVLVRTSAGIDEVSAYFQSTLSGPDWFQLEDLRADHTRNDGQVTFMRFLENATSHCIMASTSATESTTRVLVADNCHAARQTADYLRTEYWSLPSSEEWVQGKAGDARLLYPASWVSDDAEMERQAFCSLNHITCLMYVRSQTQESVANLTFNKTPNPDSKALDELAYAADKDGAGYFSGATIVGLDQITLSNGQPAVYIMKTAWAGDLPVITIDIYTLNDEYMFWVTGLLVGDSPDNEARLALLNATALSFTP